MIIVALLIPLAVLQRDELEIINQHLMTIVALLIPLAVLQR